MLHLLDDTQIREKLVKKGFEQAAKFSWKSMARQVLGIYNEIQASDN
jgi:glycosyltransferase involved in cell wall biosynthesis